MRTSYSSMVMLNLGCGTKASPYMINIDWSIYLRIKKSRTMSFLANIVLNRDRLDRLNSLPDTILVHNLLKRLPFPSNSVDVVYHSHFLEHLDRADARRLMEEIYRVLKNGGIHRMVVPDLERLCRRYVEHLEACEGDPPKRSQHDEYIAGMIEQMLCEEAAGTAEQKPLLRFIENLILGNARKRGQTHQWMYDRINLGELLKSKGFTEITRKNYSSSSIPNWNEIGLDLNENGGEYKPGSLYMEAIK